MISEPQPVVQQEETIAVDKVTLPKDTDKVAIVEKEEETKTPESIQEKQATNDKQD